MKPADRPCRVLVVDDEEDIVAPLAEILADCGYEVDVAHSGMEAVERARRRVPDAILMDIRMPDLDGVSTFREIKRLSPGIFVVFMTAYSSAELVEQARAEGALDVLPKPLDVERAIEIIDRAASQPPVLVVDDDADFNAALAEALQAEGFDVRRAGNLDDAIELFKREPRRVVLLDMKLDPRGTRSGSDGLDALLIMKKLDPRAAVILMTGLEEMRGAMRRGLETSAHAALFKPFEIADLITLIRGAAASR